MRLARDDGMSGEPAAEPPSYRAVLEDIFIAEEEISDEAKALASAYGYLPYMVERYLSILGPDNTKRLLDFFDNFKGAPAILCNFLKKACSELQGELENLGFALRPLPWCNYCFTVVSAPPSPSIGSTHQYLKGYYYVYRDAASLVPPILLDVTEGSKVLDMCAAPGGKAVHILLRMKDRGLLVANDVSVKRALALQAHILRMGFKSYIITVEDGLRLSERLKMQFDYVIVDAPCSAEGGIMFDPSRKRKTPQDVLARLVMKQVKLLLEALKLCKPGGRVLYTTCSIAPEENEYVVSKVLEARSDVKVVNPPLNLWSWGLKRFRKLEFSDEVTRCVRIWPHEASMEGYFICLLERAL